MELHFFSRSVAASNLQLHVLHGGLTHKLSLPMQEAGTPRNTLCHWIPQVYMPNAI